MQDYFYIFMCGMHVCVGAHLYKCAHVWRLVDGVGCFPPSLSTLFTDAGELT